jgi:hypothetical protein
MKIYCALCCASNVEASRVASVELRESRQENYLGIIFGFIKSIPESLSFI